MSSEIIIKIRDLFIEKKERVSEVEYTFGNYDDDGNLIKENIPTITTEFCEIGSHGDIIYMTFGVYSDSYNNNLIDSLKDFSNFLIYGGKDFMTNYDLKDLKNEVKKEKIFQINFNYSINDNTNFLFNEYENIKNTLLKNDLNIFNQLDRDLVKEIKKK